MPESYIKRNCKRILKIFQVQLSAAQHKNAKQGKTTHFLFSLLSTLSCLDFAFKLHSNKARASRIEYIAIYCRKKSVKNTFWTGNFTAESSFKKQTNKLPDLWTERFIEWRQKIRVKENLPQNRRRWSVNTNFPESRIFWGIKRRILIRSNNNWSAYT